MQMFKSKETKHGNSALRKIPGSRFKIILLFAYLSIFTFSLNHISFATEQTNQQDGYNVIDKLVVNDRNRFKTVIFENEAEGVSEMRKLIANSCDHTSKGTPIKILGTAPLSFAFVFLTFLIFFAMLILLSNFLRRRARLPPSCNLTLGCYGYEC